MLKTRVTKLLDIGYPIISAPMQRMSGGRLAAAVSSAGGLGTFGCVNASGTIGPDYIREQIDRIRSQTDKPFGAGFLTQHIARAPQNAGSMPRRRMARSPYSENTPGRRATGMSFPCE